MILHAQNKFDTSYLCPLVLGIDQFVLGLDCIKIRSELGFRRYFRVLFRGIPALLYFRKYAVVLIFCLRQFISSLLVVKKTEHIQSFITNCNQPIFWIIGFFFLACLYLQSLLASWLYCYSLWGALGQYRQVDSNYGKINPVYIYTLPGGPL